MAEDGGREAMTLDELRAACVERRECAERFGLGSEPRLQLTVPRKPGKYERMRVMPGVLGEVCCWNGTSTVVSVLVSDVERALARMAAKP